MTILGHVQRGGTPNAYDRVLGTRFGVAAVDAIARGETGTMVALRGTEIVTVPLSDALAEPKLLDPRVLRDGRGLLRLKPGERRQSAVGPIARKLASSACPRG